MKTHFFGKTYFLLLLFMNVQKITTKHKKAFIFLTVLHFATHIAEEAKIDSLKINSMNF
jgi:hypothetical protein